MRFYNIAIVVALLFVTVAAKSQNLGIGNIVTSGAGCPNGTVVTETDASGQVVLRLDQFELLVGKDKRQDLKSCTIAIPFQVPEGVQLVLPNAEVTAEVNLSKKSHATLRLESFIAGAEGAQVIKKLKGPLKALVVLDSPDLQLTSACGKSVILRANISASLETSRKSASVVINEIRPLAGLKFQSCR